MRCHKNVNFYFSAGTKLHVCFRSKINIRKISNVVVCDFFINFSMFNQNGAVYRILNRY